MREKSNSITHLVKIVANEVFDEKTILLTNRIKSCEKEIRILQQSKGYDIDEFLNRIQSSLKKAGAPWSVEEHNLLVQEVRTAIAQIAQNHKRSKGAIIERLKQYELLRKGS